MLLVQLTLGTDAEKIVPVADYLITCPLSDLLGKAIQIGDINIGDIATLGADKMWVGEWIAAVVMATGVGKAELDQLAHFLEHSYRFIDGGNAGHGKINLYLVIYLLGG
ncbi:MAG: hypothetical protein V3S81_11490 [Anaerolineales bacterium]